VVWSYAAWSWIGRLSVPVLGVGLGLWLVEGLVCLTVWAIPRLSTVLSRVLPWFFAGLAMGWSLMGLGWLILYRLRGV
jgi:hypothetical protein